MSRKKILLVDDSSTSLMIERMVLGTGAYDFVTARDGLEGVERAIAENPDLILMDVVMPRLDGIEAVRKIRQNESTAGTPIIMVTTRGEEAKMEEAFRNGCSDYVTKPVSATELLSKVRLYIGS